MGLFCRIAFFSPARPMFHVKHLCVKRPPPHAAPPAMFHVKPFSPAPRTCPRPAMFHVKHFCVKPLQEFSTALSEKSARVLGAARRSPPGSTPRSPPAGWG